MKVLENAGPEALGNEETVVNPPQAVLEFKPVFIRRLEIRRLVH
jgi:hypothetical protein